MSYILDALKKAEAERNTGTVPGPRLTSAPSAIVPSSAELAPASRQRRMWPVALTGALATAALIWFRSSPMPQQQSTTAAQAPAALPAAQSEERLSSTPPREDARPPLTAAASQETAPATSQATERDTGHEALQSTRPKTKPDRKPVPKKDRPAAPASTPTPLATLNDLPEELRQQIPPLKVGGYIYSANKADRSVLVNNRLLREGDEAAPGLILEQMQPNGMVLSFKGNRFRMGY